MNCYQDERRCFEGVDNEWVYANWVEQRADLPGESIKIGTVAELHYLKQLVVDHLQGNGSNKDLAYEQCKCCEHQPTCDSKPGDFSLESSLKSDKVGLITW